MALTPDEQTALNELNDPAPETGAAPITGLLDTGAYTLHIAISDSQTQRLLSFADIDRTALAEQMHELADLLLVTDVPASDQTDQEQGSDGQP